MTNPDAAKTAWQESVKAATPPALDTIRAGADRFYRQVRRRNRIEYAACALVIPCFTAYTFLLPSPVARIGAFLVVLATLFIAWRLHRHASADAPPEAETARPLIAHQRAQFVRQRDALAQVWRWYLLPFVPGLGLMVFAPAVEQGPGILLEASVGDMISLAVLVALFIGIWWLNLRAARQLQKAIDDLDALADDGKSVR
jgi:Flp pilus assembly protein TadB